MNYSTYIFGELSGGYSQYPEDSSSNLFKDIQMQCIAPSQMIIHRDGNMMYYIYVRKLDKNKYIGFAIVINGYYFTQIQPLFSLFENEIGEMAETGVIINITRHGDVTSNLTSLVKEEEEIMSVINALQTKTNSLKCVKSLPPVDFSVSITSQKIFKDTDAISEIIDSSCRFGFTIILKEADYDSIRISSVKNVLKNLNNEKDALLKENYKLKETNKKIQRQKKQFKNVVLLILIVVACAIGLYILFINLNDTQDKLDSANNILTEKESVIAKKNSTISNLRDTVSNLEYEIVKLTKAKEKVENSLYLYAKYSPFTMTSCEINANQFKFDYFSPEERELTITLKAVNEKNSEIVTNVHTLTFYKGKGTKSLDFYRTLDTSQYYYVFLMYDGHIIAGKRW